jgi:undecaprenyl-diphosphatase
VLVYFRGDWLPLFRGAAATATGRGWNDDAKRLAILALASVPAAALGLAFKHRFEAMHDWPPLMAATLAGVGLLLFAIDRAKPGTREEPGVWRGLVIGAAQALALVPGVSRSGITMFAGLTVGLSRQAAARFSFLLSTPAIVGATLLDLKQIAAGDPLVVGAGILASAISGYFAIGVLLRHVTRAGFTPYAVYRILLAAVILAIWLTRSN